MGNNLNNTLKKFIDYCSLHYITFENTETRKLYISLTWKLATKEDDLHQEKLEEIISLIRTTYPFLFLPNSELVYNGIESKIEQFGEYCERGNISFSDSNLREFNVSMEWNFFARFKLNDMETLKMIPILMKKFPSLFIDRHGPIMNNIDEYIEEFVTYCHRIRRIFLDTDEKNLSFLFAWRDYFKFLLNDMELNEIIIKIKQQPESIIVNENAKRQYQLETMLQTFTKECDNFNIVFLYSKHIVLHIGEEANRIYNNELDLLKLNNTVLDAVTNYAPFLYSTNHRKPNNMEIDFENFAFYCHRHHIVFDTSESRSFQISSQWNIFFGAPLNVNIVENLLLYLESNFSNLFSANYSMITRLIGFKKYCNFKQIDLDTISFESEEICKDVWFQYFGERLNESQIRTCLNQGKFSLQKEDTLLEKELQALANYCAQQYNDINNTFNFYKSIINFCYVKFQKRVGVHHYLTPASAKLSTNKGINYNHLRSMFYGENVKIFYKRQALAAYFHYANIRIDFITQGMRILESVWFQYYNEKLSNKSLKAYTELIWKFDITYIRIKRTYDLCKFQNYCSLKHLKFEKSSDLSKNTDVMSTLSKIFGTDLNKDEFTHILSAVQKDFPEYFIQNVKNKHFRQFCKDVSFFSSVNESSINFVKEIWFALYHKQLSDEQAKYRLGKLKRTTLMLLISNKINYNPFINYCLIFDVVLTTEKVEQITGLWKEIYNEELTTNQAKARLKKIKQIAPDLIKQKTTDYSKFIEYCDKNSVIFYLDRDIVKQMSPIYKNLYNEELSSYGIHNMVSILEKKAPYLFQQSCYIKKYVNIDDLNSINPQEKYRLLVLFGEYCQAHNILLDTSEKDLKQLDIIWRQCFGIK